MDKLHVHGVYGGEHVGGALHDTLPRLRHGDGCACGEEHGLVATAERQERQVVPLD